MLLHQIKVSDINGSMGAVIPQLDILQEPMVKFEPKVKMPISS
jgi:hypothetical protein